MSENDHESMLLLMKHNLTVTRMLMRRKDPVYGSTFLIRFLKDQHLCQNKAVETLNVMLDNGAWETLAWTDDDGKTAEDYALAVPCKNLHD